MAQVKIFGIQSTLDGVRNDLSDAIHRAVMDALAYPAEKRFHRFIGLAKEDFIYPSDRSDRYIVIEISVFEGRSIETKKTLIRSLYQCIEEKTGISSQDIEITIFETPRSAWGIRGLPGDEIGLNYKVEV
ncbi:tautomerase family protein [Acidocella facilis]|uniref:tautomerase family protein n=1 Tax=Acidocella facilis TaxID=525 RepID=UPI001F29E021|nr:tautomerase family protein [Acidocella facilis]